jgi:enoyl-CoA hydratase
MISLTTQDLLTPRAAARYYQTGATFGAEEAARAGLITIATSNENLDAELGRLLGEIRETSPPGAAETKRLLTRGRRQRLAEESAAMAELSARLFASAEAQEGIRAFLEKRHPPGASRQSESRRPGRVSHGHAASLPSPPDRDQDQQDQGSDDDNAPDHGARAGP